MIESSLLKLLHHGNIQRNIRRQNHVEGSLRFDSYEPKGVHPLITGADLWASSEDIPYINGEINRQGLKRIVQTIVKYEKPVVDRRYSADQHFENIVVIKTPGHTPGHVIFAYKNVLFTGDLFKNKKGSLNIMPIFMPYFQRTISKSS